MLAIAVDGRVVGDVVAVWGARPSVYRVALGRVESGTHVVSIALDRAADGDGQQHHRARLPGGGGFALPLPAGRLAVAAGGSGARGDD